MVGALGAVRLDARGGHVAARAPGTAGATPRGPIAGDLVEESG